MNKWMDGKWRKMLFWKKICYYVWTISYQLSILQHFYWSVLFLKLALALVKAFLKEAQRLWMADEGLGKQITWYLLAVGDSEPDIWYLKLQGLRSQRIPSGTLTLLFLFCVFLQNYSKKHLKLKSWAFIFEKLLVGWKSSIWTFRQDKVLDVLTCGRAQRLVDNEALAAMVRSSSPPMQEIQRYLAFGPSP